MQKQAISVSPSELRKLADDLEKELRELSNNLGIKTVDFNQKFSIPIINKEGLSDTWEFEK